MKSIFSLLLILVLMAMGVNTPHAAALTTIVVNTTVGDPKLMALSLNAPGETQTHALQDGSAALDVPGACAGAPATDQRGVTRPQGASCDLGAYEKGAGPVFLKTFLPLVRK